MGAQRAQVAPEPGVSAGVLLDATSTQVALFPLGW